MSTRPLVGAISLICCRRAVPGTLSPVICCSSESWRRNSTFSVRSRRRLDRILHHDERALEHQRLFQKVEGAQLGGPDGGFDGRVAGDHDHFRP